VNDSVPVIPFTVSATKLSMRVYSPGPGIHIRLKAEDAADPTHSVETEALTTATNAWETLTFDFASQAAGTAALNVSFTFDRLSIFFDFNTVPAASETFYFDDVAFGAPASGGGGGGGGSAWSAITFDNPALTYTLTDFGGAISSIVADPAGGTNQVTMTVKPSSAATWAGTTVSTGANQTVPTIPFASGSTTITVRVYAPAAGIHVRLKAEDANNSTHTVETEAITTAANAWQTLSFDFSAQATGTAALDLTFTFSRLSIFFDFNVVPAANETFYFDDVTFGAAAGGGGGGGGGGGTGWTAVTFDSASVTYTLTDFGGDVSVVANDPAGGSNKVMQQMKTSTAATWAGTTVSTGANTTLPTIPLTASHATMTIRAYSPAAGIHIRVKVEDANDPTHSVETEALTTQANAWETLSFNFLNQAGGTAALNPAFTFSRLSIFSDFNTVPAANETFYFDDISFP
jgi:hypothetical protein